MPADTTTPILGLLLQGTANNNNAWGINLNNSVITPTENAIKGALTISGLTGGAVTLTQAQAVYSTIILTGTLSSNLTLTAPSTANRWMFINGLAGAFSTFLKTSGGTAVQLPSGATLEVMCDGTSMYRADRDKVGELFYHGSAAQAGSLECQGQSLLRASYPDLFTAIGTVWGSVDGTHFTLPDGYTAGKFLRARTASVTVGTAQANQNKTHTHTSGTITTGNNSADHTHSISIVSGTMNSNVSHTHSSDANTYNLGSGTPGPYYVNLPLPQPATIQPTNIDHTHSINGNTFGASATHTHQFSFTTSTGSADGTEARPEALVGVLCIRY